jgi:hypothetical protein
MATCDNVRSHRLHLNSYVERNYGEAERAAEAAAKAEKARQTEARRKTDPLYKIHPIEPPELIDEGYSSWLEEMRDADGLAWAESRAKSLGFIRYTAGNVQSLELQKEDFVVYADIRRIKKISFKVFKLPIKKARQISAASFDFSDSFKHAIEDKFEARLREALERCRGY